RHDESEPRGDRSRPSGPLLDPTFDPLEDESSSTRHVVLEFAHKRRREGPMTTHTSDPSGPVGVPQESRDGPAEHDVLVESAGRRRLILAAMCVALVAVVASVSGLNVAQQ